MNMIYRNVLIPIDGSKSSDELVTFICSLQKQIPGEIHIVYVIEVPRSLPLNECPPDKLELARRSLRKSELIAVKTEAVISTQIIFARTAEDSIIKTAEDMNCDMIAITQSNSKASLFSNTSMSIYKRAKCSVCLVNLR
jgi:nucleotide-binding universal stress UspA family protein